MMPRPITPDYEDVTTVQENQGTAGPDATNQERARLYQLAQAPKLIREAGLTPSH
jgi:hypothetical protein